MSTVTIVIPDELSQELDEASRRQRRPASEIVSDSLRNYLARERFQSLRAETLPAAEAAGYLTDDDVFDAVS